MFVTIMFVTITFVTIKFRHNQEICLLGFPYSVL